MDAYTAGRNLGALLVALQALLPALPGRGGAEAAADDGPQQPLAQRLLLWGCFLRCLALVYAISLWSLGRQLVALCGSRGVSPVSPQLAAIRRDYGPREGFLSFPTLLWFFSSDKALRLLPRLGQLCALGAATLGGTSGWLALLATHMILLSLDFACDLSYPWDCLLFESGFLALFLPVLQPLSEGFATTALPSPIVAWAFRWLLFRLMLGFGKLKFFRKRKEDAGYIKNFLLFQPMMTYIGWYAQRLMPHALATLCLGGMWLVEVVAPFCLFCTGTPRLLAAISVILLQIGIQLGGNFGHFNILSAVLCIPLLDLESSITDMAEVPPLPPAPSFLGLTAGSSVPDLEYTLSGLADRRLLILMYMEYAHEVAARTAIALLGVFVLLGGLAMFAFNSWVSQGWLGWPTVARPLKKPALAAFVQLLRALSPLRLVHAYGVFDPKSMPAVRRTPVIEGSRDGGKSWQPYTYRYQTSSVTSAPCFIAPHHPRLDHAVFYEAHGYDVCACANFRSSLNTRSPYKYSQSGFMERLLQRLLEGADPELLRTFFADGDGVPFPDPTQPPTLVRVCVYWFNPKNDHRAGSSGGSRPNESGDGKGEWWEPPQRMHVHCAARGGDAGLWGRYIPQPELFHPDHRTWRRSSLLDVSPLQCTAERLMTAERLARFEGASVEQGTASSASGAGLAAAAAAAGEDAVPPSRMLDRELLDDAWSECYRSKQQLAAAERAIATATTQEEMSAAEALRPLLAPMRASAVAVSKCTIEPVDVVDFYDVLLPALRQAAPSPVAIAKLRQEMLARWSTEDDPLGLDRCRLLERVCGKLAAALFDHLEPALLAMIDSCSDSGADADAAALWGPAGPSHFQLYAKVCHAVIFQGRQAVFDVLGREGGVGALTALLRSQHRRSSNAGGGYEWQLLLFFNGQQLRLAATKQRLAAAQERARTDTFGEHEAARGYDAYKESLLVPGYLRWADTHLGPLFASPFSSPPQEGGPEGEKEEDEERIPQFALSADGREWSIRYPDDNAVATGQWVWVNGRAERDDGGLARGKVKCGRGATSLRIITSKIACLILSLNIRTARTRHHASARERHHIG